MGEGHPLVDQLGDVAEVPADLGEQLGRRSGVVRDRDAVHCQVQPGEGDRADVAGVDPPGEFVGVHLVVGQSGRAGGLGRGTGRRGQGGELAGGVQGVVERGGDLPGGWPLPGLDPNGCAGKDYLGCWNKYWDHTKTEEFKAKMREIVAAPDFLENNYLSAEFRVPVTLLHTNACSPLATNGLGGNIWDNFTSQSYKELPSVGEIVWYHPVTGEPRRYTMPAGGTISSRAWDARP